LQVETEERSKASYSAQNVAIKGLLRQVLDTFLGAVAAADVNTGIGVGHGFGFGFVRHGAAFCGWSFRRRGWPERLILAGFERCGCVLYQPSHVPDRRAAKIKMESRLDILKLPHYSDLES
jgi:hypothetical protein